MANSNKTVDSGCWRGFEEKENLQSLFMGLKTAPATLETIVKNPQKAKNKVRFFFLNGSIKLNKSSCGLVLFLPHATANMS